MSHGSKTRFRLETSLVADLRHANVRRIFLSRCLTSFIPLLLPLLLPFLPLSFLSAAIIFSSRYASQTPQFISLLSVSVTAARLFIDVQRWRQTFPHIKRPSAIIIISCWHLRFVFLSPPPSHRLCRLLILRPATYRNCYLP